MDKKKVKIAAVSAIGVAAVAGMCFLVSAGFGYVASRLKKSLAGK